MSDLIFSNFSSSRPDVTWVRNYSQRNCSAQSWLCLPAHHKPHIPNTISSLPVMTTQNAAKGPYSVCAGLTPCLVYMPHPCCSLPLLLDLPPQDPTGDCWGPWLRQGCLCQRWSPWHMLAVMLARGSSLLVSYKDRSWAWKQRSVLQAEQGSSCHSARQRAAQSHWLHYLVLWSFIHFWEGELGELKVCQSLRWTVEEHPSVWLYFRIPFTRPEKGTYKMWQYFVPLLCVTLTQPQPET